MDPVPAARGALADALLRKVAGPDPATARGRIHRTPGPRWFEPDSAIARVHGDASMFIGGIRALLLQSLHPLAMAAVAAHSGYRGDPWGRLTRTATFLATTTFATVEDAERAVAEVVARHERVRGRSADGEPYRASDPRLLTWVHVAEVDSFLIAHQRYGRHPLDDAGCDEYVAQAAQVARRLGAEEVPTSVDALHATLRSYRPELRATEAAREAAHFLRHETPLPAAVRPAYGALWAAAVALLPVWARAELGLRHVPALAGPAVRAGGRALTGTIRWALDAVDPGVPEEEA